MTCLFILVMEVVCLVKIIITSPFYSSRFNFYCCCGNLSLAIETKVTEAKHRSQPIGNIIVERDLFLLFCSIVRRLLIHFDLFKCTSVDD